MSRKNTTILATIMVSILAFGAASAQEAGNGDADRNHEGQRGKGMPGRGQHGPMDPERVISMMTRRLELDETQVQQVRNIYLAAEPEFAALRESGRANRMAMRDLNAEDTDYAEQRQSLSVERDGIAATAEELRDRIRSEVEVVLTSEQREKFATASERGRERGQRRRHRDEAKPEA